MKINFNLAVIVLMAHYQGHVPSPITRGISKKQAFVARVRAAKQTRDYSAQLVPPSLPKELVKKPTSATRDERIKAAKQKIKSLGDYARCPERIRCGQEVVVNHASPVTIARGLDFGKSMLINDHHYEYLLQVLHEYAPGRPVCACVAWLTDKTIIEKLSLAEKVMIIVNDEDYSKWGNGVVNRQKYAPLPAFGTTPFSDYWGHIETPLNLTDMQGKNWEAVRCFGQKVIKERENEALKKEGISQLLPNAGGFRVPIMHAKFMVISDKHVDEDGLMTYTPRWLWMGSMNFTGNSANNIEQCIFVDCEPWAMQTFFKFGTIFLSSSTVRY